MPTQEHILYPGFTPGVCDFCVMSGHAQPALVYTDPETQCRYCLPCLAGATDPANQLEDLPPTEEDMQIASAALAAYHAKQGNTNHARN